MKGCLERWGVLSKEEGLVLLGDNITSKESACERVYCLRSQKLRYQVNYIYNNTAGGRGYYQPRAVAVGRDHRQPRAVAVIRPVTGALPLYICLYIWRDSQRVVLPATDVVT